MYRPAMTHTSAPPHPLLPCQQTLSFFGAAVSPVPHKKLPIQIPYGVTVLDSHMEVAVFLGFWKGISFPDKLKRYSYGSHLFSHATSPCLK